MIRDHKYPASPCILSRLANSGHLSRRISLDPGFSHLGTDPSPPPAQDDSLLMALSPKVHSLSHATPIGRSKGSESKRHIHLTGHHNFHLPNQRQLAVQSASGEFRLVRRSIDDILNGVIGIRHPLRSHRPSPWRWASQDFLNGGNHGTDNTVW